MRYERRLEAIFLSAFALFSTTAVVFAQESANYPNRPIRMIVPFAPGGSSDFVARIIQSPMTELLGVQLVVDNRGGAAGNIGVEVAANATPDGYNIFLGNDGTMAVNPNFYTKFPIKPLRDFIQVTEITDVPGCLVVHPSLSPKSVKELIAYLKANPGKLNYGSPAPTSSSRLDMEMFLLTTGTKAVQIPYKGGAGPATIALLGNEVQLMFVSLSSTINFVKQGRLRMLGVIAPERVPVLPDVPTMREQGYDRVVGSWQGIFVPKGTPLSVVNKLFKVAQETMKEPDVVKRMAEGGVSIVVSKSPADFAAFHKRETERFAKVIADAHIETE